MKSAYDIAVREIIDEYERVSGQKADSWIQLTAVLNADAVIDGNFKWSQDNGQWILEV